MKKRLCQIIYINGKTVEKQKALGYQNKNKIK